MIINPSFLYPDLVHATWVYGGRFSKQMLSHPYLNVHCACQSKDLLANMFAKADEPMPFDKMMVQIVTMKVDVFANKFAHDDHPRVSIWAGKCPKCNAIYWTCDSFEWAGWMTDLQTVTMLTGAVPLNHLVVDTARYIVIQGDTRIWFDLKGKIREVR